MSFRLPLEFYVDKDLPKLMTVCIKHRGVGQGDGPKSEANLEDLVSDKVT